MQVLVSDKLSPEGLSALKKYPGLTVIEAAGKPRAEILKLVVNVEGLITRSETQVDKELLEAAKKLKVVGRAGVGVDNIDIPLATERGIVVMNAPEGNTIATCELTFSHLMNAFRPIVGASASMTKGEWDRKTFMGTELYGKTLGVIGLGRIGAQVAKRAIVFGMKVIAYDPFLTADRAHTIGVAKTDLETLLKNSDAITLHTPLTEKSKHILNAEAFGKMKKGVRIVNCARGELIDEAALIVALDNGTVAHAGVDVYPTEPLAADSPLRKNKRITLTPHLGASTNEAQASVGMEIAESVAGLLLEGQVKNAINAPSVSLSDLERLQPSLFLAGRLGAFVQAMAPEGAASLTLSISMNLPEGDLTAISRAVMRGFLSKISGEANEVSAPKVLERLGINFEVRRSSEASDYSDRIELSVAGATQTFTAAGALIGKSRQARLVSISGVPIELSLSGKFLLVIQNQDVPGIVGYVGSVLGASKINIANMTLGRTGKTALTLLELDSAPDEMTLEGLQKNVAILTAQVVAL